MAKRQPKKRAQMYTDEQQREILDYLANRTIYPERNRSIFLLSSRAGLRAGEIAQLCWHHVLNYKGEIGNTIRVSDDISKGKRGREFEMSKDLISALKAQYIHDDKPHPNTRIALNYQNNPMTPNAISNKFHYWFVKRLNWHGFSSHSGRRTFITKAAQNINLCGGSIYDVSMMAGHNQLSSTQDYIEGNTKAQKKVVNMI